MKTITLLLLGILFIVGCKPDQFYLNSRATQTEEISGLKVCQLDSVEVYAKNALRIFDGGMVDLICADGDITQFQADFTTEVLEGEGVRFVFRTILDTYPTHPSITFDYSVDGCTVYEENRLLTKVDSIKVKISEKSRILIENYGKLVNIVVGCDTVYYGPTRLAATEHIIIQTHKGSKVDLSGIIFSDLNADLLNINNK